MPTTPDLMLHEELLLLTLDDESGAGRSDLAIGGGLLAELSLRGAVSIEQDGKKAIVRPLLQRLSDGDALLEECLTHMNESEKLRPASHWVNKFARTKDLKARTARPLVDRGILDERKRKILFFNLTEFPEANPVPEALMTERLRSAIEDHHVTPDDRTIALVVIADASGLLRNNLDKKLLRQHKDRIKALAEGDQVSAAVKAAIDAVTMTIIIAASTAAVAST